MSERLPHRLVRASAGTGKTYRLTLRFLELMVAGAAPERILATTFTRKAAGEILERLLLRLARAVRDPRAAALLRAEVELSTGAPLAIAPHAFAVLLERVCASLHRLQVSTLDSFFHRAMALFRHELGLPRFARVAAIADPLLEPLRVRGLQQALGDLSRGDIDTLLELLGRLYRGDAQRSVVRTLDSLVLAVYEPYRSARDLAAWSSLGHQGQALSPPSLAAAIDRAMGALAAAPHSLHKPAKSDLERAARGDWAALLGGGLARKVLEEPTSPTYRQKPLPPALVAAYQPLVEHAGTVLLERIAQQTIATHHLLAAFEGPFGELRRRAGVVLYSELVDRLQELFADGSPRGDHRSGEHRLGDQRSDLLIELFFRLDGAVHHLLLDELQDTSLEQWSAIEPVVEELLAHGDGSRSLFCVGDPKQSIYGWRGGRVELFGELEERMRSGAGEVEVLAASWRSSPVVLDSANRVFGPLEENLALVDEPERRAAERFVSSFDTQVSAHPERPGYVVLATSAEWEGIFEADAPPAPAGAAVELEEDTEDTESLEPAEEDQRPIEHLDYVADRVCEIADRLGVGAASGAEARQPVSIGVLCLTNRTVRELRGRLEDRGVDASGEGAGPLDDDPAVAAVVSALRLAEHPGASAAAFHVASGPLGVALGLADWRRPEDVARRLRRELVEHGAVAAVSRWVRAVSASGDERNARRLQQLAQLLPSLVVDDPCSAELARRIESSLVEEPMPATVRVMTVHQAKGLEFDVVVLGELERRIGDLSNPLLETLRVSPTGPVAEVHRSTNQLIRGLSEQLVAARREELERRALDDLGVLYVALTRARFELHLWIQPFESKGIRARTFAALLTNALASAGPAAASQGDIVLYEAGLPLAADALRRHRGDGASAHEAMVDQAPGEPAPVDQAMIDEAAPSSPRIEAPLRHTRSRGLPWLAPSELGAGSLVSVAELLVLEPGVATLRGRVLHEWLAGIEWLDGPQGVLPAMGGGVLGDEEALLRAARRHDPRSSDAHLRALLAELRRWTESETLRSVLTRPVRSSRDEDWEVWRERPFVAERDGSLVRGVFDRAVIHLRRGAPAAAELFEWKTSTPEAEPSSAEPSVPRHRHEAQLEAYRDALAAMLGLLPSSVSASILYLSTPPGGGSSSPLAP